jgi:esterase/lipase
MKNSLKVIATIIVLGIVLYYLGPKPKAPQFQNYSFALPNSLTELDAQVKAEEKAEKGIRPDNEARIVWADSIQKKKTPLAFLYIHGFSASQEEGDPVHTNIAQKYGANLYLARLAGHGIDLGDATMQNLSTDEIIVSVEKALAITKKLGNEVIIIGTSFGGALTLYLAAHHPEIKAIALYSPCIKIYDDNATLLDNHWGKKIATMVMGSEIRDLQPNNPLHAQYWSMHYHVDGLIALQNFLTNVMIPSTFEQVKCPTFLGYYYKNEEEQDKVVSVPAMLKMYEELGVPNTLKRQQAFPNAGHHVIGSYVLSNDYANVQKATEAFLDQVVLTHNTK